MTGGAEMKIGLFDSGVGGLSVLKELVKEFPNHEYYYYADTERAPYGKKTEQEIKEYSFQAVNFLLNYNVDVIIIACNTATKVALSHLRRHFHNLTFIGIEPPITEALNWLKTSDEKVLVFATPITVNNLVKDVKYKDVIHQIKLCPITKLVTLAEQGELDKENAIRYLSKKIKDIGIDKDDLSDFKCIILGCTHFPFFKESFVAHFPKQRIMDGTSNVILELKAFLSERGNDCNSRFSIRFFKNRIEENPNIFNQWIEL